MEKFCGSTFWDADLTWNTSNPYFTPCFESSVLKVIPAAFLFLFGVTDILQFQKSTCKSKSFFKTFTLTNSLKAGFTLVLIILQCTEIGRLGLGSKISFDLHSVDMFSPAVQIVAHMVVLILQLLAQNYLLNSSGLQFFYWLLVAVTQAICFRTTISNFNNLSDETKKGITYFTTIVSFPIIFARLSLEFFNCGTLAEQASKGHKKPSPETESTFISKLFHVWYDRLAWTGYRRILSKDDLWDLDANETANAHVEKFSEYWKQEEKKARGTPGIPSAWIPLIKVYGLAYVGALFLKLVSDMLQFVHPSMLNLLLAHIANPQGGQSWKGFLYATVICITLLVQICLNASSSRRIITVGMQARAALSNAVFRKSLAITSSAKKDTSVGEMINLQSVDSQRIVELLPLVGSAFAGPFQFVISGFLLYRVLGASVFPGVALFICLIPLNIYLLSLARKFQMEQMKLKDERLKLTSEVLSGIKVLKLYAWENAFQAQIETIRLKEIQMLKKIGWLNAMSAFGFQSIPVLALISTLIIYVSLNSTNILNAQTTFVAISLFNIIRLPMINLPNAFSAATQSAVSMTRLSKYLYMEELDKSSVTHDDTYSDPIVMNNATLSWTTDKEYTLKDVNMSVKEGELVAIVGAVGSGKSSLLSSLLGDLQKLAGVINTKGDTTYVSQSAWIQNTTIKENILFGDKFDEAKYERIIEACALEADLQILPFGDQTEIGEKGINLSGGQKQRVALARAAYREASIYLFDDPLSAVDSHVGKHIFENLLSRNGILKKKTRILVTHAASFLSSVDMIYVMKKGKITESGTYEELMSKHGEFAQVLLTHLGENTGDNSDQDLSSIVQDLEKLVGFNEFRRRSTMGSITKIRAKSTTTNPEETVNIQDASKQVTDELAAEGNIKLSIFVNYFKSAGVLVTTAFILSCFISHGFVAISNIWLAKWSTQATKDEEATQTSVPKTTRKYSLGFGLSGLAAIVSFFIAFSMHALLCPRASKVLHAKTLSRVLKAPMSYFDTTLLGRTLSRFSRDLDTLDNTIPVNLRVFFNSAGNVIFSLIVIFYTRAIFIGFILPLVIVYIFLQRFYAASSRQLKRIESVTRSPIFSHFGETISGSSTIRAFGMEEHFITESEKRIDDNQKAYYPFLHSVTWLTIRLEFLGLLISLATCLFVLFSRDSMDPGDAGLAITYFLQITTTLTPFARQTSDLESNIISAERIGELAETPQECDWDIPHSAVSGLWPTDGQIIFESYMTRYREGLDLVLKGISCTIEPGEKVGVVGRTGAGKTSLTLALFRIIEAVNGRILIDGIEISSLGLHQLRKNITIIPQDPVLFSGSLRFNLDPFGEYSDNQVWSCLELAHLKGYVASLGNGLHENIEEEGQNFSVGQRQLICLARALLRKTKVLVLDEATASVDLETDALIQATIRKEFAACTVITIAHRLNTIVDSNRVMVLDKGKIMEFDSPEKLLQDPGSIFWGMARDAKLV